MVDVAVSAQLQQWTFEKTTLVRPERSDSSASSPDLYHNDSETLRIDAAAVEDDQDLDTKETMSFQERYLSSEEDLSPMEADSDFDYDDDDVSIHEVQQQTFSARKMSISRIEKGKSFDLAVMVSYVSAGRPKMINLANIASPVRETAQRSASLAQLPIAAIKKLRDADQATRHSFVAPVSSTSTSRSSSPASDVRRLSTGNLPFSHDTTSIKASDSSSSFVESASSRSSSPSASEVSSRPATSAVAPSQSYNAPRSSLYVVATANGGVQTPSFPPLTPLSPDQHSFLSTDPYENNTTSAASPIIKSGPHKRLRSISQKLALAKIAITPSKKWDSRINGRSGTMPPTPATPYTPVTPMTAPPTTFSSPKNRLRRNSRASRPTSMRGPSPDIPPVPTLSTNASPKKLMQRMVPRGADEREPILELPPCPTDLSEEVDPMGSIKSKRIRKRKSLMDLL